MGAIRQNSAMVHGVRHLIVIAITARIFSDVMVKHSGVRASWAFKLRAGWGLRQLQFGYPGDSASKNTRFIHVVVCSNLILQKLPTRHYGRDICLLFSVSFSWPWHCIRVLFRLDDSSKDPVVSEVLWSATCSMHEVYHAGRIGVTPFDMRACSDPR